MAEYSEGPVPSDADQTVTKSIYGSIIAITVLATIAVILRFVARRMSKAPFSYDDYSIVLALIFLYGLNIDTLLAASLWGLGKHFVTLSQDQILNFSKNGLASFALFFTTTATTKMSLLLLYYRLFCPCRSFRIAIYIAAFIVIAWWIAVLFADIFQCVPISGYWDYKAKFSRTSRCMSVVTFSIGTGVSNLLTDVMVLCLPIPMVWSLNTNRAQKITLTGIFMLGFFVCAISIVRIVKLLFPETFHAQLDITYGLSSVFIWSSVEPSVGVISACLPIMRPLFGKRFLSTGNSRSKSDKTSSTKKTNSSSQPASVSLASPLKDGFTRLDGATYRDQLETSERETLERNYNSRKGSAVAHGSYDDKAGRQWLMYGPRSIDREVEGEDWRMKEGRAIQMREWPKRRESLDWTEEV